MAWERSWKTTAGVVVAVAAALLVVWKLRTSQRPAPADGATRESTPPTAKTPHRVSARPAGEVPADPPEPERPSVPGPDENTGAKPMAELLRRVPAEMKAAAKHCVDPDKHPPHSAERVTFRYTVVYKDGEASVSEVIPVDTNMDDEDLQNCILDAVEELVWPVTDADDQSSPRQQLSISIYDLSR